MHIKECSACGVNEEYVLTSFNHMPDIIIRGGNFYSPVREIPSQMQVIVHIMLPPRFMSLILSCRICLNINQ